MNLCNSVILVMLEESINVLKRLFEQIYIHVAKVVRSTKKYRGEHRQYHK